MGKLIDIEENIQHSVSEVICVKCGYRWIAVRPITTLLKEIECKNCGKGFVIESGQQLNKDNYDLE